MIRRRDTAVLLLEPGLVAVDDGGSIRVKRDATEAEAAENFADTVAHLIIHKLQERLTFPTVEDVERIRDHVSPNGVAFRNGAIAGREEAEAEVVKYLRGVDFAAAAACIESGFHRT